MKKLLTALFLIVFAVGLFFVKNSPTPVKADAGAPVTITATYNSNTGQLNTSGSYAWKECEPGEETNILGFALFTNGGTPATNNSNALDGSSMHLANSGNPCTTTPDNWVDNSHILSSAPTKVCVVVYDVRADDSADPGGIHSLIGAGGNYNADNSWNLNGNSYPEGSCATPALEVPTPTPTPTPISPPSGGNGGVGGPPAGEAGPPGPSVCGAQTPPAPNLKSLTSVGLREVELIWDPVEPTTHYNLSYGPTFGNYLYGVDNTGKVNSFRVGGLGAGTYCFAVRAVNDCAPSSLSNERCTGAVLGVSKVLGVSTLGATGSLIDELFQILFIMGSVCLSLGLRNLYPAKRLV